MPTGILSPAHLLVVLLAAVIVVGPRRLPGAGRALGQSLREFKDSIIGAAGDRQSVAEISQKSAPVTTGHAL